MGPPQVVRELKSDSFGRVELLDGHAGLVVRRVACGGRAPGSRVVARVLAQRERIALARLDGVPGVARLLQYADYAGATSEEGVPPTPADVLLRSWIEGVPLHAATRLPRDFFERLTDLVEALHARGVCHNDLHKEPNVLVTPDGYPALVDFQLASVHARGGRAFRARVREDLRHVTKHQRRYFLQGARPEDAGPAARRGRVAAVWMRTGKPVYNFVTRRLLRTRDGEPRRPSAGPWPTWTAPVGPR
jgi:serine/threonine protein kinase